MIGKWEQLKSDIAAIVKENGRQEITGELLKQVLLGIVTQIGSGATLMGFADTQTDPGEPDGNFFWFAKEAGVYEHFGGIVVDSESPLTVLYMSDGVWVSWEAAKTAGAATIVPVQDGETSILAESGKYYRVDDTVNRMAITLPEMQEVTTVKTCSFYLNTGNDPDVTFESADGKPVSYQDSFNIEANKSYIISAAFNGLRWIVSFLSVIALFLSVSPKTPQWVTMENPIEYRVSSNVNWFIS